MVTEHNESDLAGLVLDATALTGLAHNTLQFCLFTVLFLYFFIKGSQPGQLHTVTSGLFTKSNLT